MNRFFGACADVGDDGIGINYEASRWVRAVRYRQFVESQLTQLWSQVSISFVFHDVGKADV